MISFPILQHSPNHHLVAFLNGQFSASFTCIFGPFECENDPSGIQTHDLLDMNIDRL